MGETTSGQGEGKCIAGRKVKGSMIHEEEGGGSFLHRKMPSKLGRRVITTREK